MPPIVLRDPSPDRIIQLIRSGKNIFINGLFEMLELDDSYFIKDDYISKFSN